MKKYLLVFICIYISFASFKINAQNKTDANLVGHVVCCGEHIPFASVYIKGTTIGTTTDETGHFQLINLPPGEVVVRAQALGYKPAEQTVTAETGTTKEIKFELERDMLGLEEVVVTGDRKTKGRHNSSVVVNSITPVHFRATQSVTLGEGLNFCPGLRMENNCQNCGFSQIRMNGMEGPYSQILINNRPIFSGLAGVYGLELIPANMIERVEVVRGGGSALYGSNAIAGTINLILKDPGKSSYEFGTDMGVIGVGMDGAGDPATDYNMKLNTSLVSGDSKTGMSVYGFHRNRQHFDANGDEFSELASIENTTIGSRLFHRFGYRSKLTFDFFNINENRRGGNKFEYPKHEADIAEALEHNLFTGALSFDQYFRDTDLLSVYISGQNVDRDSYYGANQSLKDYGKTSDFTYNIGAQYFADFKSSDLIIGIENTGGKLKDKKLGYPDYENAVIIDDSIVSVPHVPNTVIADQTTNTFGAFTQYEINISNLKASLGLRYDHYNVKDNQREGETKTGDVFSPRVNLMYDITEFLQARLSYSQGYRAPQIFDEDLHIETSGSRQVIHRNAPDLKQETSHSITTSLTLNKRFGKTNVEFVAEGFYIQLVDPFANEFSEPDSSGVVVYTRVNAEDGAKVMGVNLELNIVPKGNVLFKSGLTIQKSEYDKAQEFNEKRFFRTPDSYGYTMMDWKVNNSFGFSASLDYTGKMLVPYFGVGLPDADEGELRESDAFFDLGVKLRYNVKINGATLQIFGGVKNIFNSYQDDFDYGVDRDPGYIYGPLNPRTIYFGINIGNKIKS